MNTVETNPFRHGHERAASRSSTGASRAPSHSSSRSLDSKHSPGQHHHHHPPKYSSRRRGQPMADTIDSLDKTGFGGAYHHGGPYDATLASVNANKKYAPMEAVKDSNIEALKATPREYIVDSLQKHVPLQGTGIIPPGMPDMRGNIMNYEEGADLMREPDAGGGAYKRWDFVQYSPDDLKGKGEPSFTIERTLKHSVTPHKHSASFTYGANGMPNSFEMQDQHRPLLTPAKGASESIRRQSFSSTTTGTSTLGPPVSGLSARPGSSSGVQGSSSGYAAHTGLQRNASTGHRITDGLKRRLGSLRRKHD